MDELHALLTQMLGPEIAFALGAPGEVPVSTLHPSEVVAVERAVDKRRLEMAAGRATARRALARLGHAPGPIPRGEGGAPVWPAGVVGSITHTDTLCVAAVAPSSRVLALGLDAEPEGPLDDELWPSITTDEELSELRTLPAEEAGERARWIFCAKEAAYKCQYPTTGLLLDFADLQIRWTSRREPLAFEAVYQRHAAPFRRGDHIPGSLGRAGGYVVAVARLSSSTDVGTNEE